MYENESSCLCGGFDLQMQAHEGYEATEGIRYIIYVLLGYLVLIMALSRLSTQSSIDR
jgi:hypothetical protein